MTATEYYNDLEQALKIVDEAIAKTEIKATDEFARVNYSEILNRLYNFKRSIERMQVVHRYNKLSKEAWVKQIQQKTPRRIEVAHKVKSFETPHGIAKKYGITVSELLQKNNITTSELTAGMTLYVEIASSGSLNKIYEEIPTFGDQEGDLVFGKDLGSELKVDTDGDLKVLEPLDTLRQGIENRIYTAAGDYPMLPEFGVPRLAGEEYPEEIIESFHKLKIIAQLGLDKRIQKIEGLEKEREQNAVTFTGTITAINNKEFGL